MKTNMSHSDGPTNLRDAVENLYAVFSPYTAPQQMLDVCTACCMDAALEAEMRRLSLHELSVRHFYEYNSSAKSPTQPVDELKYLLPRMLELLATGADLHHSPELHLVRLGNCEASAFSKKEYAAIEAFALAYFAACLSHHAWQGKKENHVHQDVFEMLLMFYIGGIALQPMLDYWLENESTAATLHYVSAGFFDFWPDQNIQNAFATDRPQFQEAMKTWLSNETHRYRFSGRILELDMTAIDQTVSYYGGQIHPKDIAQAVFDLITY